MNQDYWENLHKDKSSLSMQSHPSLINFINMLKADQGQTILDLGCGPGGNLVELAVNGFTVTGVDFSPSAVEIAEKWIKEKNLVASVYVSDLFEKIKFIEPETFDGVVATDAIHYTEKSTFLNVLKEINRVLKTSGLLFLTVPSKSAAILPEKDAELFFDEEEIRSIINESFEIKYFDRDSENNFVIISSEK